MQSLVRGFLAVEALSFYAAALLHSGRLVASHFHAKAATAESVIGTVLLVGLLTSLAAPRLSRAAGLFAQGFALLGTCVGIFTIVIGIGPRTPLDFALHAGFIALLVTGLVRVSRTHGPAVRHA
jgi:ABC-type uncharacterized transport system permease subunit